MGKSILNAKLRIPTSVLPKAYRHPPGIVDGVVEEIVPAPGGATNIVVSIERGSRKRRIELDAGVVHDILAAAKKAKTPGSGRVGGRGRGGGSGGGGTGGAGGGAAAQGIALSGALPLPPGQTYVLGANGLPVMGPDGRPLIKRRRGRPPNPNRPPPPPPRLGVPAHGPELRETLARLLARGPGGGLEPGQRVWVSGKWPGVAWSLSLCRRADLPRLLADFHEDRVLVRYYGEHTTSWVKEPSVALAGASLEADRPRVQALRAWSKPRDRMKAMERCLEDCRAALDDPVAEVQRVLRATEGGRGGGRGARGARGIGGGGGSAYGAGAGGGGEGTAEDDEDGQGEAFVGLAHGPGDGGASSDDSEDPDSFSAGAGGGRRRARCGACHEPGAELVCALCERGAHSLCLPHPALDPEHLPEGRWACPSCGAEQRASEGQGEGEDGDDRERMGLTPDWIISAACFEVMRLPRPTKERPYIAGLLDPCTNSLLAPNIPAEVLYDRAADGLSRESSWKGYSILLNPPFSAQLQWRFVNRAIDAVESGEVPAVVLVCRNSTDAGFFQRLRPYPRVLLRRTSARFKDYDKTPIGFGIAVFAIAPHSELRAAGAPSPSASGTLPAAPVKSIYERFLEAFSRAGEPCIPIDRGFLRDSACEALLARLRGYAARHHRDHWAQCTACQRWRLVDYQGAARASEDSEWKCADSGIPGIACDAPLTKWELAGARYQAGAGNAATLPAPERDVAVADGSRLGSLSESASPASDAAGGPEDADAPPPASSASSPTPHSRLHNTRHRSRSESASGAAPPTADRASGPSPGASPSVGGRAGGGGEAGPATPSPLHAPCAAAVATPGESPPQVPAVPAVPPGLLAARAGAVMAGSLAFASTAPLGGLGEGRGSRGEKRRRRSGAGSGGDEGDAEDPSASSGDESAGEVLSALELARAARIAANRAYLASLGAGLDALHGERRTLLALPPTSGPMQLAARRLATRGALETARQQRRRAARAADAAAAARRAEEPALRARLEELCEAEEGSRRAAERACEIEREVEMVAMAEAEEQQREAAEALAAGQTALLREVAAAGARGAWVAAAAGERAPGVADSSRDLMAS